MGRRLSAYVHGVVDGDDTAHSFGPDDVVPDWAQALITNPSAWIEENDPAGDAGDTEPAGGAAEEPGSSDGGEGETPPADEVEFPPRGGAGSGRDAWAEFAKAKDFEVADDAGRDDIIAALEEAGVIAPEAE